MSLFRSIIRRLGPGWLVKDKLPSGQETDSRVLYAIQLVLDAQAERLRQGILARYPGPAGAKNADTTGAPDDALYLIGRDRLIRRGPSEPRDNYVARLQRAIDDLRVRGNAWAMLEQVQGFLAPSAFKVALVNEHGNFYTIAADGTRTRDKATPWDWDGSAIEDAWARFWIIIYSESGTPFEPEGLWGSDGQWGDGGTWGSTATVDEVAGLRAIVQHDWKMAGSFGRLVISFDDSDFAATQTAPPLPDGTWGNWSKNVATVQVATRNPDGRYGTP